MTLKLLEAGKVFGTITMPEIWTFGYTHQGQYLVFLIALVIGFLLCATDNLYVIAV